MVKHDACKSGYCTNTTTTACSFPYTPPPPPRSVLFLVSGTAATTTTTTTSTTTTTTTTASTTTTPGRRMFLALWIQIACPMIDAPECVFCVYVHVQLQYMDSQLQHQISMKIMYSLQCRLSRNKNMLCMSGYFLSLFIHKRYIRRAVCNP